MIGRLEGDQVADTLIADARFADDAPFLIGRRPGSWDVVVRKPAYKELVLDGVRVGTIGSDGCTQTSTTILELTLQPVP